MKTKVFLGLSLLISLAMVFSLVACSPSPDESEVDQDEVDVDDIDTDDEDEVSEGDVEITTEVVVVGGGGAGLASAASAHEHGAEVIVIEKQAMVGGSTALSGGGIAAPGTRFQEELGIEDSKEDWMSLWEERQATSNPDGIYPDYDFVDKFMEESIVTTEWMTDYIGHEYETVTGYGVDPEERLHFPVTPENMSGGMALIQNMQSFLENEGVE